MAWSLFDESFDLHLPFSDSMSFIPVYLSSTDTAVE